MEARQDFLNFLKNYTLPEYDAPILPYRRVLSYAESEEIWARFEFLWLTSAAKPPRMMHFFNMYLPHEFPVKPLANKLQEIGVKRLLNLGLATNYEVDIALMYDMFSYDDSYWTSKTLDWYILAEGHGSAYIAGRVIEKLMVTIPWLTDKS